MRAQLEHIAPRDASFVACKRLEPSFPFFWHYHPEFELTLIVDSRGQRLVGDGIADYGPGDLILLGPNLPHSWRSGPVGDSSGKMHQAVFMQFRGDFLGDRFFASREMSDVARMLGRSERGLAFGHTATGRALCDDIVELPQLAPPARLVRLLSVLTKLAAERSAEFLSSGKLKPVCRVEHQQRLAAICTHLDRHFSESIDFAEVAGLVHMDPAALCRFFKRATGRTMSAYINELRVSAAAQLLADTDLSILEIALRVGFANYSNFYRQFQALRGSGPRTLRRKLEQVAI